MCSEKCKEVHQQNGYYITINIDDLVKDRDLLANDIDDHQENVRAHEEREDRLSKDMEEMEEKNTNIKSYIRKSSQEIMKI
jgi:hypothetical protein